MGNEIIKITESDLHNKIYTIHGQKVMLDSDLALLYQVETKRINEAVSRNKEKFPERFSWLLDDIDMNYLRSQIATANVNTKSRVNNRVFTEQGVYMLATILRSKVATEASIAIMDAFVMMRNCIDYDRAFLYRDLSLIEEKVDANTKKIDKLFNKFGSEVLPKNYLFFEGQIYDAYSLLIDILNTARDEIIIIDNYVDKSLLDILKEINTKILIVSKNINKTLRGKYESQYKNISFLYNTSFHDRFIIIDKKKLYSCGASFKDLGKKCFAINEMKNEAELTELLVKVLPPCQISHPVL